MSDPRNVIACVSHPCETTGYCPPGQPHAVEYQPVLDLPDAEHVHITRHPDGTITAVPMQRAELGYSHVDDTMEVWLESAVLPYSCMVDLWVDCPTGGDQ